MHLPLCPAKLTLQRRAYRKVMTMGPFDSMAFVSCVAAAGFGLLDSNGLALANAPPTVTLEQLATLSIKVSVAQGQMPVAPVAAVAVVAVVHGLPTVTGKRQHRELTVTLFSCCASADQGTACHPCPV